MDKERGQLLAAYEENLATARDKNQYLNAAAAFLESAPSLDRPSIDAYLAYLRESYKPGTIRHHFGVIRRLFAVNGLSWPYRRGEGPQIKERDEYRPQLAPEVVAAMIKAGLEGRLLTDETCFLALSTTYGLRREEMANLQPKDVDFKNRSIFVATLKHGRERYHLIPPEILPYLENHDFSVRYGLATLRTRFWNTLRMSTGGRINVKGLGWHAIRRPVYDGLVKNGVDVLAARKFLRWRSAIGDLAMPARYYGNVVVGLDGEAPVLNEAEADAEIFEKHPFLPYWRG